LAPYYRSAFTLLYQVVSGWWSDALTRVPGFVPVFKILIIVGEFVIGQQLLKNIHTLILPTKNYV